MQLDRSPGYICSLPALEPSFTLWWVHTHRTKRLCCGSFFTLSFQCVWITLSRLLLDLCPRPSIPQDSCCIVCLREVFSVQHSAPHRESGVGDQPRGIHLRCSVPLRRYCSHLPLHPSNQRRCHRLNRTASGQRRAGRTSLRENKNRILVLSSSSTKLHFCVLSLIKLTLQHFIFLNLSFARQKKKRQ